MPGRQAHGNVVSSKKSKPRKDNKKRSQNAFAIALQENEEKVKVRRSRLGDLEGGDERPRKRSRNEDDDEGDEQEEAPKKARRNSHQDIEEGSDSEGNEWRMGDVDVNDDSDLDSDEAFGESDEEKFDGYAFSGSQQKAKPRTKVAKSKNLNLDEDSEIEDDDDDDDSLGEDAIDLATVLDQGSDSEGEDDGPTEKQDQESSEEEEGDEESNDESSSDTSMDDDDADNPEKLAALQNLINSLPPTSKESMAKKRNENGANEFNTPSEFGGLSNMDGVSLEELLQGSVRDSKIRQTLKLIDPSSDKKAAALAAPLPRRQQDRLDRAAAYEKSKETLDKWKDTVAHNRRADHLVFPLPDADTASLMANTRLQATTPAKPFNELEAAIQSIMEESGLAAANGKDDEDKIREYEELQTNKMSIEEVKARRDQLRMARELMFREEAKAKRIKKIKSKSYRKVHRKEREREERKDKEALLEAGIEPSEDEQEAQDRRRAMERMGDRHRGSKWAKATKSTGRAAWDEDARAGITEMARRDEELRKRVEGKSAQNDSDISDDSYDDSADDESDEGTTQQRLIEKLNGLDKASSRAGPGSKLANMDFMLKADAAKKRENDRMVEEMRKELAGEDSEDDSEPDMDIGRRSFGPAAAKTEASKKPPRAEFEEPDGSDDEVDFKLVGDQASSLGTNQAAPTTKQRQSKSLPSFTKGTQAAQSHSSEVDHEGGAWSSAISKKKNASSMSEDKRRRQKLKTTDADEIDITNAAVIAKQAQPLKKMKKAATGVTFIDDQASEDESDSQENSSRLPFAIKDQELIKRAFAGADVVGDFEAEKRQTIADEDEQVVDNTLPGWGSWTGDGLSKKEKKKNKGRFLTKTEGIKEANRKDARLEKVIINEKRVKKVCQMSSTIASHSLTHIQNNKYLATQLPHQFETKQQYERSLRLPVGPEWATKETVQNATKPRILLKQGIIAPMSKPLL